MGQIRNIVNRWMGNEVNVIHRPDSRPSLLNPQDSVRDRILRDLRLAHNNGDAEKVLELLDQIKSRTQIREIFEANQIGVEDRRALNLFKQLASNASPDAVRARAREIIFAYAHEKAAVIIKEPGSTDAHPHGTQVLDGLAAYLDNNSTPEAQQKALSTVASGLGYHITGLRQAVLTDAAPDAKASKNDNLLWQLYSQNGIGSVIYSLLNESNFIDDNKRLMSTAITHGEGSMDLSMNGDLQKANLLAQTKRSVMGIFGSWSSCNFTFEWKEIDALGATVDRSYNLDQLLTDVCKEGPAEANNKFIDAYVKLVEYKETLREDPITNAAAITRLEKEQTKALKFLFDSNKLQATGSEGEMIYQALQDNMKLHGSMRFLSSLFKSVIGPNEIAEIVQLRTLYREAFPGTDLTFVDDRGGTRAVETLREYKLALEQKREQYQAAIELRVESIASNHLSDILPVRPEDFADRTQRFNNLCQNHRRESQAIAENGALDATGKAFEQADLLVRFKAEMTRQFRTAWSTAPLAVNQKETLESLISYARSQMPETFKTYGAAYEQHIKASKAINAIELMETKASTERTPADNLILRILAEDKVKVERQNSGRDVPSYIETLFRREVADCPDVNSTLVGAFELMRRISADATASDGEKQAAREFIVRDILNLPDASTPATLANLTDPTNNPLRRQMNRELYALSHQIQTLDNQEEPIRDRAKHKFSAEIVRFIKVAIPNADINSLDGDVNKLESIVANLITMQGKNAEDPTRQALELENLKLLGIDMNSANSFGFDQNAYIGSLIDPRQDISMIELFMETLKSVFEYIKMMSGPSVAQDGSRSEQKKVRQLSLTQDV